MGYSRSTATLDKMRPNLVELEKGNGCVWTLRPNESAAKFAYKLREALAIAKRHPQQYPELAEAAKKFTIEVLSDNEVQARIAKTTTAQSIQAVVAPTVVQGMEEAGGPRKTEGPQTAMTIIQTWLDAQPSNDRFHFPDAAMERAELVKLYNWANTVNWMLMVASDGGLTLTRKTRDIEEYAWNPEDDV